MKNKISVHELRIGNILWYKGMGSNGECIITELKQGEFFGSMEGIPLDDIWLFRLGFKSLNSGNWWCITHKDIELAIEIDKHQLAIDTKEGQVIFDTHIMYVHQLQNLLSDLTNDILIGGYLPTFSR